MSEKNKILIGSVVVTIILLYILKLNIKYEQVSLTVYDRKTFSEKFGLDNTRDFFRYECNLCYNATKQ